MPKFMLILRGDTQADYSQFTPDDFARILGEYEAWGQKMASRLQIGRKLTDEGGKVIWPKPNKKVEVKDGPYVEPKEVVGGVYILTADNYDHAVKLCDGHPNLQFGSIEVRELPSEYVILSAHLDSWDAASGATDDGAGVVEMLEAMRILRVAYPRPRRTLLIALWSGEEQGLQGSRAFVEDHPEVLEGLQALWNRDRGTGRVDLISAQGLVDAGASLRRWLSLAPREVAGSVELELPGAPSGGGSDYSSFVCAGAPAFPMGSVLWDYDTHTWHSNRDTYDKLVFDELRNNVALIASLAYLASEDQESVGRARADPPAGRGGRPASWPACVRAQRSSPGAQGP
jgi:hypothetical protein